jgi:Protein of unknown function (DUF3592)
VGFSIVIFVVALARLDLCFFLSTTKAILVKADKKLVTKKLSRSQVAQSYQAVDIRYKFEVDGGTYYGENPFFEFDGWHSTNDTIDFLQSLQLNESYRVWYDRRDPTYSFLFWDWGRLLWIFCILLLGVGAMASAFLFKPRIRSEF